MSHDPISNKTNSVRCKYVIAALLVALLASIELIDQAFATTLRNQHSGGKSANLTQKLRTTRKTLPLENARRPKSPLAPVIRANLQASAKEDATSNDNQADKRDYYDSIEAPSSSGEPTSSADGMSINSDSLDSMGLMKLSSSGGDSELSFNLMNSAKDRIAAVKSLLQNQTEPAIVAQLSQNNNNATTSTQFSGQCNHKGRVYASGQLVPIEDQPCLSCTCLRSIMQCFLRVCPPVVATSNPADQFNSHKKFGTLEPPSETPLKCRMVKEPSQCCPTMKCEGVNESVTPPSSSNPTLESPANKNQTTAATTAAATTTRNADLQLRPSETVSRNHIDPSLRDSILLITSNPAHHQQAQSHSSNLSASAHRGQHNGKPTSRYDYSSSLLDALIESAYSNAAQMNGLSVAGSCLINGSLYVEGSAVLTEANSFCQFCYCIRQKIMCVRPKCHLYISGCKPKYGSEFACCPTSYECTSGNGNSHENSSLLSLGGGRQHSSAGSSKELVGKISAALESISRLTQMERLHNSELQASRRDDSETRPKNSIDITSNKTSEGLENANNLMEAIMRTVEQAESEKAAGNQQDEAALNGGISARTNENNNETDTTTTTASPSLTSHNETHKNSTPLMTPTTTATPPSDELLEPMNKLGPHMSAAQMGGVGGCLENGRHYEIGEQIPTLDRCKHCYCGLEGTKECKIVECSLKMAHDCKPVIPKDHCCPIRYECPGSQHHLNGSQQHNQSHFNHNSTQLAQRNNLADSLREAMNRYRSEELGVEFSQTQDPNSNNQLVPTTTTTTPSTLENSFITQCSLLGTNNASCNPEPPTRAGSQSPAKAMRQAQAGAPFNWPAPTGPLEAIPGLGYYQAPGEFGAPQATPSQKTAAGPRLVDENRQQTPPQGNSDGSLSVTALNEMLESFTRSPELNSISENNNNNLQNSQSQPFTTTLQQNPAFFQGANEALRNGDNSAPSQADSANMTNLSDDLNKFIMNINMQKQQPNGTNTNSSPNSMPNDIDSTTAMPLSPVAVHNQQPRMAADYHSVQAEPDHLLYNMMMANNTNNADASPPQPQAMGIPSIEPELIGNLPRTDHLALVNRNVGANGNNEAADYMNSRNVASDDNSQPRDFSGNSHDNLTESFVEYANSNNNSKPDEPITTPMVSTSTNDDEYLLETSSGSGVQPKPKLRFSTAITSTVQPETGSTSVIFDDEASHNTNGSSSSSEITNNLDYSTTTSASITPLQDDHYDSTPFPPQPTTGTPLGFPTLSEAAATPESGARDKGWFRSLAGAVVNSFGLRFNPSNNNVRAEPLEGATSDNSANNARELATARSTGQTILKQWLEKFMRSTESTSGPTQASFSGRSMGDNTLIMRPLEAQPSPRPSNEYVAHSEPMGANLNADLNLSSSSELVTSSIPFTTDTSISEQTNNDNIEPRQPFTHNILIPMTSSGEASGDLLASIQEPQAAISVRLNDNDEQQQSIASGRSTMLANEQQTSPSSGMHMVTSDARLAATCLDPITNITYQSGEKMPRTDNCMACTCFSGQPLCSPLICPAKPAENCYEDKAAHIGECCPSYVCTDNASQLRPQNHRQPISAQANKLSGGHHSARMMTQLTNQQQQQQQPSNLMNNPIPAQRLDFNQNSNNNNNQNLIRSNPLISTTGLFRSLPAHLRYPPQKNAPILPNLVAAAASSSSSSNNNNNQFNHVQFPAKNFLGTNNNYNNNNNNLIRPNENTNNNNHYQAINKRLQAPVNPIIGAPDFSANRQIVAHPATYRQPQLINSSSSNNNNEQRNPVWWNSWGNKATLQPMTSTTTSLPPILAITNGLHESQNNLNSNNNNKQETKHLVPNEVEEAKEPGLSSTQFSPIANSVDPAAFRPLAKPIAGPLPSNSVASVILPINRRDEIVSDYDKSISKTQEEKTQEVDKNNSNINESEDQMSLTSNPFQVSKCDVSGKLYNIGETIESLSSRCKHCVCTPIGVDCQTRLC